MDSTSSGRAFLIDFSNSLAEHVELAMRAIVAVNARVRLPSTGVHWSRGVVVTAAHTIKRNEDITATLPDGRTARRHWHGPRRLRARPGSGPAAACRGSCKPPANVCGAARRRIQSVIARLAACSNLE